MSYPDDFDLCWTNFYNKYGKLEIEADFTASEVYRYFIEKSIIFNPNINRICETTFNKYCRLWFQNNGISIKVEFSKQKKRGYGIRFLGLRLPFEDKKRIESIEKNKNKATARRRSEGVEPRALKSESKKGPMETIEYIDSVIGCLNDGGLCMPRFFEVLKAGKIKIEEDLRITIIERHEKNAIAYQERKKKEQEEQEEKEAAELRRLEKEEIEKIKIKASIETKERRPIINPKLPINVSDWGKEIDISDDDALNWMEFYDKKLERKEMSIVVFNKNIKEAYNFLKPSFEAKNEIMYTRMLKKLRDRFGNTEIGVNDQKLTIPVGSGVKTLEIESKKSPVRIFKERYNTEKKKAELMGWTEDDFRNRMDELFENYEEDESQAKEEIRKFIEDEGPNYSAEKWKID